MLIVAFAEKIRSYITLLQGRKGNAKNVIINSKKENPVLSVIYSSFVIHVMILSSI
jgi:hypothetical protein